MHLSFLQYADSQYKPEIKEKKKQSYKTDKDMTIYYYIYVLNPSFSTKKYGNNLVYRYKIWEHFWSLPGHKIVIKHQPNIILQSNNLPFYVVINYECVINVRILISSENVSHYLIYMLASDRRVTICLLWGYEDQWRAVN